MQLLLNLFSVTLEPMYGASVVSVSSSPIEGLKIHGPETKEFTSSVSRIVPDQSVRDTLADGLRLSVVVENESSRPIRGITMRFEATNRIGKRIARTETFEDLDPAIPAFFKRRGLVLISMYRAVSQLALSKQWGRSKAVSADIAQQRPVFGTFTDITATIDSVIFDDGQFAGPDIGDRYASILYDLGIEKGMIDELRLVVASRDTERLRSALTRIAEMPKTTTAGVSRQILLGDELGRSIARFLLKRLQGTGFDGVDASLVKRSTELSRIVIRK